MKTLLFTIATLFSIPAFSQLGINVRYQNLNNELWQKWTIEEDLFSSSYEVGLDYWFRLKNYRVEFMPEIYHYRADTESSTVSKFRSFGLSLNTHFYIFDFIGDCNCPTFSKDGNGFTKGFFLTASPFIERQQKIYQPETMTFTNFEYGLSVGAGVDIGLSDLVTITPIIRYKFIPNVNWDTLALLRAEAGVEKTVTNLGFVQFGLRLGFRPDYVREQNKYRFRR